MNNNFLISVIVPVYNVSEYLEECIESITAQTIGFDKIQLILVDDGSSDTSPEICRAYADKYPNNIIFISQDNAGVSVARNRGLEKASGNLITFLDGDDKWSSESFYTAYNASCAHPDISVFSCKMVFFDAEIGDHQLNYKYAEDRIVDIRIDYNCPQLSSSSVFYRKDAVGELRFLEGMKYSEDFRFVNELLLTNYKMMLLKDPVYYYRRRPTEDSAIQRSVSDSDYYIPTCNNAYVYLFNKSIDKFGNVIRYLQFCVMYDLRWRLKLPLNESGLSSCEMEEYFKLITDLLHQIDDDIILEQKRIALALQLYALELKHGKSVRDAVRADSSSEVYYNDIPIFNIGRQAIIRIEHADYSCGILSVKGQVNIPFYEDRFEMHYSLNNQIHNLSLTPSLNNTKTYLRGVLKSNYNFQVNIPVETDVKKTTLLFYASFDGKSFVINPRYASYCPLNKKRGYLILERCLLYRKDNSLVVSENSMLKRILMRLRCK